MGHTYYYYVSNPLTKDESPAADRDMQYELDGASEAHDPSQPSTNTCPYLPGQTVNTLWIPVEQSLRKRSASLTSLREEDFKTMDPANKYVTPRPAPTPPSEPARRLGTAPLRMQQKRPARSPSPSSRWFSPRKLFSRKSSSSSLNTQTSQAEDERSLRSEGSRSRDISPESLRRFLVDDAPLDHEHHEDNTTTTRPAIHIPEDIVEENEDDDNFATSAISETMQFTGLSPPPPRAPSPAMTITALTPAPTRTTPPRLPTLLYTAPLATLQPELLPPQSPDDAHSLPGFDLSSSDEYDDDDEEEEEEADDLIHPNPHQNPFARNLTAALSTYSLPRTAGTDGGRKLTAGRQQQQQPAAGAGGGLPSSLVLSSPIPDGGLGELVSELGWMAGLIRGEEYA
jgi:hypothetical protein